MSSSAKNVRKEESGLAIPRKGFSRRADVPPQILAQLNYGEIESRTLAEWLAIDFGELLKHAVPELAGRADELRVGGVMERTRTGGRLLLEKFGHRAIRRYGKHRSDTVRQWAAVGVGLLPSLPLARRLELVRPFADDPHMGVREIAWLSVRPHLAAELEQAVALLSGWSREHSANLRRFASEATRPRGVWCEHISRLKENPELGLPIIEPLKSDASRYVQNSVANWLNDAAKTQPGWVKALCKRWSKQSATQETTYITRRALRSL